MEPVVIAFVALQAVALALAIGVALARTRSLEAVREQLARAEAPDARRDGEPADAAERLIRRAEQAEFALGQRMRDLAYLADLVGVGIVRLSDDQRVEVANTAAHVFLEQEPDSMVGRTAIEAIHDHRVESIAREASERGAASGEVGIREPDGPRLVIRARRSPVNGVWLVLEDVAELRRLQRIRAEFIDNLSHELRTPITTVGLLAETLSRDAEAAGDAIPTRMRERIAKLEVETSNISQMVAELLDLARIESGSRPLLLDEVDVGHVVVEAAERLRPFADRQHVALETHADPGLPPVRGEGQRLAQVVVNLVHNAVKFSPAGGHVRVTVEASDGMVLARVTDDGAGIAAADLPRIFERFYKADRARTGGGGTGLGLAIARHIVEAHGGRIGVESREGAGSTFTVELPAVPAVQVVG